MTDPPTASPGARVPDLWSFRGRYRILHLTWFGFLVGIRGADHARSRRQGALEVTQRPAVWGLAALTVPLAAVLGLVAWRVWREGVISDVALAAMTAAVVVLLVARPGGGLLSDVLGSGRRTLAGVCPGTAVLFLVLSTVGPSWPWVVAVVACTGCSFFVQAGAGTFGFVVEPTGEVARVRSAPARPVDAGLADVAVAS